MTSIKSVKMETGIPLPPQPYSTKEMIDLSKLEVGLCYILEVNDMNRAQDIAYQTVKRFTKTHPDTEFIIRKYGDGLGIWRMK